MNNLTTVQAIHHILSYALVEADATTEVLRMRRDGIDLDLTDQSYSAPDAHRALVSMRYCAEDLRRLANLLEKSASEAKLSPLAWP